MIDARNIFNQRYINNIKTYENIKKVASGQGDDYKTACLKVMQQINLTEYLDRAGNTNKF